MARFSYPCQESLAADYEARGGSVVVRKDKNGSRRVRIDGGKEMSVFDAMRKLEAAYEVFKTARP